MNRGELVTAIQANGRFNANQVNAVRDWLNTGLGWVWDHGDWEFKRAIDEPLAITALDRTVPLPVTYGHALQIFNEVGDELEQLDPGEFSRSFLSEQIEAVTGPPEFFTIREGEVELGPTPDADRAFFWSYEHQQFVFSADGSTKNVGGFTLDSLTPPWYPLTGKNHYVLVHRASFIGQAMENDPSAIVNQQLADQEIDEMRRDKKLWVPAAAPVQYGRQWDW